MGNICPRIDKHETNPKAPIQKQESSTVSSDMRNNMIIEKTKDVYKYYEKITTLGEGSMGSVCAVRKKSNTVGGSAYIKSNKPSDDVIDSSLKKIYALKSVIVSRVSKDFIDELKHEISILRSLDHPNIVKAYEVYSTSVNIYIVLEHCSGGDLSSRHPYTEAQAAKITSDLLSAIAHLHEHKICHRDLKFENILFENESPDAEIKLIDFGLSKKYTALDPIMTDGVGTMYTIAPEVLTPPHRYTNSTDLWSVGVITYMLLCGEKPFPQRRKTDVIRAIVRGHYSFDQPIWRDKISKTAIEFVKALLQVEPEDRLTARLGLNHEWLNQNFSERLESNYMDSIHNSLSQYNKINNFKKMALNVIAHKSSNDEIKELRRAFDEFDKENNGTVSLEEFKEAMMKSNANYTDEEITKLFKGIDVGGDGRIYYTEFLAATLEVHGRIVEERIAEAFDRIDSDDTGFISKKNLMDFLGKDATPEKVESLIAEVDIDKDGKISFDEFMTLFQKSQIDEELAFQKSMGLIDDSVHPLSTLDHLDSVEALPVLSEQ